MKDITVVIADMACEGCAETVREALEGVPGVQRVEVSLDRGEARVTAREKIPEGDLATAVEDAGYTVNSAA